MEPPEGTLPPPVAYDAMEQLIIPEATTPERILISHNLMDYARHRVLEPPAVATEFAVATRSYNTRAQIKPFEVEPMFPPSPAEQVFPEPPPILGSAEFMKRMDEVADEMNREVTAISLAEKYGRKDDLTRIRFQENPEMQSNIPAPFPFVRQNNRTISTGILYGYTPKDDTGKKRRVYGNMRTAVQEIRPATSYSRNNLESMSQASKKLYRAQIVQIPTLLELKIAKNDVHNILWMSDDIGQSELDKLMVYGYLSYTPPVSFVACVPEMSGVSAYDQKPITIKSPDHIQSVEIEPGECVTFILDAPDRGWSVIGDKFKYA